ncbi:hypothetical protein JCM19235_4519 [Vibrio maritimus]|uniref:Uncharacterized protein n=1 Tax=Vibrio maritimus TaxID=990268 RepID=A0A090S1D9_9VIBR|nr:hypothetical protein JCM19235_4519 [Vibrio maritimus]
MKLNDSPVTEHHFQGHHFYLKGTICSTVTLTATKPESL